MRVIAGEYGGRILRPPKGRSFRPTTDRVKETMFNILSHRIEWNGVAVCDLFAGSGSLGLEALSRGAARAVFVDRDKESLRVLRANIETLGVDQRCTVVHATAERFLAASREGFDLILADPPYEYSEYGTLTQTILHENHLNTSGMLCLEHARSAQIHASSVAFATDRRVIGETALFFASRSSMTEGAEI